MLTNNNSHNLRIICNILLEIDYAISNKHFRKHQTFELWPLLDPISQLTKDQNLTLSAILFEVLAHGSWICQQIIHNYSFVTFVCNFQWEEIMPSTQSFLVWATCSNTLALIIKQCCTVYNIIYKILQWYAKSLLDANYVNPNQFFWTLTHGNMMPTNNNS